MLPVGSRKLACRASSRQPPGPGQVDENPRQVVLYWPLYNEVGVPS